MTDNNTRKWLTVLAWGTVFAVSGFLGGDTVVTMTRVGLFGRRPPLPVFQTVLHMLMAVAVLALLYVFHSRLERIVVLIAAAAASSTTLYGMGLRSDWLSAFRLLSHLAAYTLIMVVAGRKVAVTLRRR
jgi:hypothetical protein